MAARTGLRILIVDNDPVFRGSCRELLESSQIQGSYSEVETPQEALGHLKESVYDVLVTGHALSGMTGIELLEIARANHPDMCRVLVTGIVPVDVAIEAVNRAHVHGFIRKPTSVEAVGQTIHAALARVVTPILGD